MMVAAAAAPWSYATFCRHAVHFMLLIIDFLYVQEVSLFNLVLFI